MRLKVNPKKRKFYNQFIAVGLTTTKRNTSLAKTSNTIEAINKFRVWDERKTSMVINTEYNKMQLNLMFDIIYWLRNQDTCNGQMSLTKYW